MIRPLAACIVFLALSVASAAHAQAVPHEFFTYPSGTPTARDGLPTLAEPGARASAMATGEAPVYTAEGPQLSSGFDDSTLGGRDNGPGLPDAPVRLDRDTGPEGMLRYAATFTPSVVPHKRVGVRDAVVDEGSGFALVVADPTPRPVELEQDVGPGRDVFVADLQLRTRSGQPVPIPSPAAATAFHAIDTAPPVPARLLRDSAENWFVVADHDGPIVVSIRVSAPRSALGGALPRGQARIDLDVPPRLQTEARAVLDAIGIVDGMSDVETVEALTRWFGSFEAAAFPEAASDRDPYRDIALGRIGVCRHRAHAFVLTSLAAGVPARYVYNESHAFVEVQLANGWRRVDLGGAAAGLEVLGDQVEVHTPPDDPLTDLVASDGAFELTGADLRERAAQSARSGGGSDGDSGASGDRAAGSAAGTGATGAQGAAAPATGTTPTLGDLPPAPGETGAANPPEPGQPHVLLIPTRLTFGDVPDHAYRGTPVRVTGRLTDVYGGAPEHRTVEIWLGPADASRAAAPVRHLASVTCDRDGAFVADVVVPDTLDVGTWGLYAVFDGDSDYEPARTE